jgi:hypothetical protein
MRIQIELFTKGLNHFSFINGFDDDAGRNVKGLSFRVYFIFFRVTL